MKVYLKRKTKTNKDVVFILLFSDHGVSERDIVLLSMVRKNRNIKFCLKKQEYKKNLLKN